MLYITLNQILLCITLVRNIAVYYNCSNITVSWNCFKHYYNWNFFKILIFKNCFSYIPVHYTCSNFPNIAVNCNLFQQGGACCPGLRVPAAPAPPRLWQPPNMAGHQVARPLPLVFGSICSFGETRAWHHLIDLYYRNVDSSEREICDFARWILQCMKTWNFRQMDTLI